MHYVVCVKRQYRSPVKFTKWRFKVYCSVTCTLMKFTLAGCKKLALKFFWLIEIVWPFRSAIFQFPVTLFVSSVFNLRELYDTESFCLIMPVPGSMRWRARNLMMDSLLGTTFSFPLGKMLEDALSYY